MMASRRDGPLYLGATGNLPRRVWEHRAGLGGAFTSRYKCFLLVWAEGFPTVLDARAQEARMKGWRREWKVRLIEERNPEWRDLSSAVF